MTTRENCTHEGKELGYGFASSAGFKGLGIHHFCVDCFKILDWIDDLECNTPEEIEHNKKRLAELKEATNGTKHENN